MDAFIWFIAIEFLGLLALPFTCVLFKRLPDRGYAFGKALSILVITFVFWLAVSANILPNSQWAIILIIAIVSAGSLFLFWRRRDEIKSFIAENRRIIIATEVLFIFAFIFWVVVRAYNPNILFGEKYMDIAYINAILRTDGFPPYDPWLSGYDIGFYYYFGYLMIGTVTKFTGIASAVTFNLTLALVFALTVTGAFSIVYNLVRLLKGSLRAALGIGLISAAFVALLGNLEGVLELFHCHGFHSEGFWKWVDIGSLKNPYYSEQWYPTDHWWWWRASRVIGTSGADYTINEFPYWSALFADLHPHLIAIPFALLNLAIGLELFLSPVALGLKWIKNNWGAVLVFAICLGSLIFINSWDMPVYCFLILVLVAIAGYKWKDKIDPDAYGYANWGISIFAVGVLIVVGVLVFFVTRKYIDVHWAAVTSAVIVAILGIPLFLWRRKADIKEFIHSHLGSVAIMNALVAGSILVVLAVLLYIPHTYQMVDSLTRLTTTGGSGRAILFGIAPYYSASTRPFHLFLFWNVFLFIGSSFVLTHMWDTFRTRPLIIRGITGVFAFSLLLLIISEFVDKGNVGLYVLWGLLLLAIVCLILYLAWTAIRKPKWGCWGIIAAILLPLLPFIIWAATVDWPMVQSWVGLGPEFLLDKFGFLLPALILLSLILIIVVKKLRAASGTGERVEMAPIFALILFFMGFLLLMGCELFNIDDRGGGVYERVTTVFKLYLQAWVFMGAGSAFGLYWLAKRWRLFNVQRIAGAIAGAGSWITRHSVESTPESGKQSSNKKAKQSSGRDSGASLPSEPGSSRVMMALGAVLMVSSVWIAVAVPPTVFGMIFLFFVGAVLVFVNRRVIGRARPAKDEVAATTPLVTVGKKAAISFWWAVCIILIAGSCVFPLASSIQKTHEFSGDATLNGMKWIYDNTNYRSDYEAITWLNENVDDYPVIVEAVGSHYNGWFWVSAYTGLPTIVGRWGQVPTWIVDIEGEEAKDREGAAEVIYNASYSVEEKQGVLARYNVTYVYVGYREHNKYGANLSDSFPDFMDVAFENEGVTIYQVRE